MPFFSGRCLSTVKLVGKTAVITGCNTGIGKETALDFYKRGRYDVVSKKLCLFKSIYNHRVYWYQSGPLKVWCLEKQLFDALGL